MRRASGHRRRPGLHGDVGAEADVAPGAERRRERSRGGWGKTNGGCQTWRESSGVSGGRLRDWAGRGWLRARRVSAHGLWIIWADGRERARLRSSGAHSRRGESVYPQRWTTPKPDRKN